MRKTIVASVLCLAGSLPSHADNLTWETKGKPIDICYAVQKNVRFFYNAWANGATDTYGELKTHMNRTLADKGVDEAKLLAVYGEVLPKIESNELLPPNVPDRRTGHEKAKQIAGAACLKAFDGK